MSRAIAHWLWFMMCAGLAAAATKGDGALAEMAKTGDIAAVQSFLSKHKATVSINQPDAAGATALHWAVERNDLKLANLLIRGHADVNALTDDGVPPLVLACRNGSHAMVGRLLEAGADAKFTSAEGETVLMTAARAGDPRSVVDLVEHGADVNAKEGWHGQTALMWAAGNKHSAVVKVLLDHGAAMKARSNAGITSVGSNIATGGFTPLLFAVRAGDIESVKLLLAAGADVNDKLPEIGRDGARTDGTSALVLAVINAHYELAGLLLEKGADPNSAGQGWTALHQLVWTRDPNHHYNIPPPFADGKMSSLELAKALLDHGAQVNAQTTKDPKDGYRNWMNRIGSTPFLLAAKAADLDLMRLLLARGADPSIETKDHTTVLMAAAGVGYWQGDSPGSDNEALEAVKIVLALGADVNAVNAGGYTAMHGAATRGANAIVQLLYDKGAKLDVKTKKEGWLPLTIADGVLIAGTYKDNAHTAVLLRKLMAQASITPSPVKDN